MKGDDFLDLTLASLDALDGRALSLNDLRNLLSFLLSEDILVFRDDAAGSEDSGEAYEFALALGRIRIVICETLELAEFGRRMAERAVIGGGISVILIGISTLFSQTTPFIAILPIVAGAYLAFRGYLNGRRLARTSALCQSCLLRIDRLSDGLS